MIEEKCFEEEWLDRFKKLKEHQRIDKIILEKMIYALHLLERLQANNLKFIFKGGTSLVLLLQEGTRFSIDIDIICDTARNDLEEILHKVVETSHFSSWQLDEHRSYKPGVPKAHYKFNFESTRKGSGAILLDILIEESIYPELIEIPIDTKWIETSAKTLIKTPSIDAITGDKLTAFAPLTIGIPYFKGKDKQPFTMEICKQLFDLSKLFERINDMRVVAASFHAFANQEIAYRKQEHQASLTPEEVLSDTLNTCVIFARRGKGSDDEKEKFRELQKGVKAFGTGFLMEGRFRIDDAISASARIAFLAAKILTSDLSPISYYQGQDIKELVIDNPTWNFLNPLKRLPDKSTFYYWHQAVQLLRSKQ